MAGVQKVGLNHLNMNIKNALIVGIIIAKNTPRTIGSKKKNGESRGVTSFTIRDSNVDTINVDVWGSEYFVLTFYERFLVGDVVEITSPKICVKTGDSEIYRPQVTSPFYLSINEGMSDVSTHCGDTYSMFLPLLHIPTKQSSGYYGIAEVLKLPDETGNVYVDLLVVVKSVKPAKSIKTKTGLDMSVRGVEIMDNTTPASITLDIFDNDTIQSYIRLPIHWCEEEFHKSYLSRDVVVCGRVVLPAHPLLLRAMAVEITSHCCYIVAPPLIWDERVRDDDIRVMSPTAEEWRPLESVLFIADARVSWRARAVGVQVSARTVITHQPHTADAEALRLHIRNQASARGGEAAAWAAWSGERSCAASVSQVRDRVAGAAPFCASLHALLTHLDLDELDAMENNTEDNIRVRFADHTGELTARLSVNVLEDSLGYSVDQLKSMSAENRSAVRWAILLEQCTVKLAASPPRLIVLGLRRATQADPIPLY